MRSGTTITFLGALPSSARMTASSAKALCSTVSSVGVPRTIWMVAAQLAVHLHRDGDAVGYQQRRIVASARAFRPPACHGPAPASSSSARCGIIGADSSTRASSASRRAAASALARVGDGVGERIDLRHRAVEAQMLQIFGHRGDGLVRGLAQDSSASSVGARLACRAAAGLRLRSPAARCAGQNASSLPRPASVHSMSRSGGVSDSMNQRMVSAP